MVGIVTRPKTTRQPAARAIAARIPAGLGRGLRALFDQRYGIEVLSGARPTSNTAPAVGASLGIAAAYSGTRNQQYAHTSALAITGALSIVVCADIDALSNYGALVSKMGTTTTNIPYELRIGHAATDGEICFTRASTNYSQWACASNVLASGMRRVSIGLSVADGNGLTYPVGYVNGSLVVITNVGAGCTDQVTDNGSSAVWIGRRYDGATQLTGELYYIALWDRALRPSEFAALANNHALIFPPRVRQFFFGLGAGGTVIDVSLDDPASGASAQGATLQALASLADSGAAIEAAGAIVTFIGAHSDAANAADAPSVTADLGVTLSDAAAAEDAPSTLRELSPLSNVAAGNWSAVGTATLPDAVNEAIPSESEYARSGNNPTNDTWEVLLDPSPVPLTGVAHIVAYELDEEGAGASSCVVGYYCGATLIKSWNHATLPADPTRFDRLITAAEAAAIDDETDLRLRFVAS